MKWDIKIVVLLVKWSSFRGGLKARFYCISFYRKGLVLIIYIDKLVIQTLIVSNSNPENYPTI